MGRTNITAKEKEIIENMAEVKEVEALNTAEVEAVKSAINGMSEQEMRLAAETLPIGILFDRIKNEVIVNRQKLDAIAAIINE